VFIQLAGYDIEADSRIYNFDVMDPPRETHEFTVEIESKTSRWGSLKLQDGPASVSSDCGANWSGKHSSYEQRPACALRSRISRNTWRVSIRKKRAFGHKSERAFPSNPRHTQVFPAAEKPVTGFRT